MRPSRISLIHFVLVLVALALVGQAARVQLIQGSEWSERARRQHFSSASAPAPRGAILDASGNVLVESRELVRVSISRPEVRDTARAAHALREAGFAEPSIAAALDTARRWTDMPGLREATQIAQLRTIRGVILRPVAARAFTSSGGMQRIIGRIDQDGRGVDGLELGLDSILRGDTLRPRAARDTRGRLIDSPDDWEAAPRPGATVALTINLALQEICERALASATDSLQAAGGDIVVLNPGTGEILAMASRRTAGRTFSNTAVSEPFEPGSTLKPFIAAALLERGRARSEEETETFNGYMMIGDRLITDLHRAEKLSLSDVIRYSSNIGIVKFAERLTPREKYETLRDFGFGTPTGVPLPAEAEGTVREPARWNRTSAVSMVMGYEVAVTPLQLVAAYAAIANGGTLLEPQIVKEVRSAEGAVLFRAKPRAVRRVMSEPVAREIQRMLLGVVETGTATRADLATFSISGKSGTARRALQGRGYVKGEYVASFVGLFPADRPQYVVLVKLDSPRRAYLGGEIAAPVTKVVLSAALAARDAALSREGLASAERKPPKPDTSGTVQLASHRTVLVDPGELEQDELPDQEAPVTRSRFTLPMVPGSKAGSRQIKPIPETAGLTLREAVRALHAAGFRVRLAARAGAATTPAAGSLAPTGALVTLSHRP